MEPGPPNTPAQLTAIPDPESGRTWLVELDFLASSWECIWGEGCVGIGDEPDADAKQGCCSLGAQLLDENEARWIATLAASLDPDRFHHAGHAVTTTRDDRPHTTVIDGACVFFNPVDGEAPTGCALHLAAVDDGEPPMEWKPAVCWQLPIRVEHGEHHSVLRRWQRSDWGAGGADMAWCCSVDRSPDAFTAATPVHLRLRPELVALCGPELADAIAAAGA